MAVVNVASTTITNITAAPPKPNDLRLAGRSFSKRNIVTTVAGNDIASHFGFFRLPAIAVVQNFTVSTVAMGGSTAADFGLWETSNPFLPVTQAGSISNAKQFFVAGLTLVSALTLNSQAFANSAFWTIANAEKRIWDMLGITADPASGTPIGAVEYDVVATLTAAVTTGGAMMAECAYKMQ